MMKKLMLTLSILAVLICGSRANANLFDINLSADCDGYSVTGSRDWCFPYHNGDFIILSLHLSNGNGFDINVSDQIITYGESGCPVEPVNFSGSWGDLPCGDFIVDGTLVWKNYGGYVMQTEPLGPIALNCPCEENLCTRTPGYWKNHPEAWPVDSLMIGDTTYSKEELLEMLNKSVKGDIDVILIKHLIAAKLNVLSGSSDGSIELTIAAADAYLAGTNTDDDPEDLKDILDAFNNSGEEFCD